MITEDSPGPMMALFVVEGGLIYFDKPTTVALPRMRTDSRFSS